ncbi:MAG: protoporphyrinogen/coproporphyrinogen oxidase, partial [Nocardioidaceae bacterium]
AAAELGQIEYASMALVTLALRASAVDVDLAGTGFLVPPVEGRQIKAATYTSRKWGWLADDVVMVRCSIGRHRDLWQLQRADGELVDAAVADLRDAVGLTGPVLDTHVQRWGGALPQYAVGHLDRVRRARAAVGQHPGLALCGAALDGVGVPACVATGQEAATQVVEHLASRETMGT